MKFTVIILAFVLLLTSCKKDCEFDDMPGGGEVVVTTAPATVSYKISGISATIGGAVTSQGVPILLKGVVWDVSPNPEISLGTISSHGPGIGSFSTQVNGLKPQTKYYVRAFAVTNARLFYGNEITFTTAAIDLADKILLYLPFTGGAADSSGHQSTVTVNGATLTSDRYNVANAAYSFSTSGAGFGTIANQIYVNYASRFNVSKMTVALWVNMSAYFWVGNPADPNTVFINRGEGGYSSPNSQAWTFRGNAGNINAAVLEAAPGLVQNSFVLNHPQPLPLNTWTHIAFTYDQASLKIYINGQLVASGASSLALNTNSISGISIGQSRQANGHWNNFAGKLDEVQIWGRALTGEEISYISKM